MTRYEPLSLVRVVRDVGAGDADERAARARVAALAAVDHPGLLLPLDVRRDGDAVQVCTARQVAPSLSAAGDGGVSTLGEWVWLVAGVAEALAALHGSGLSHGDVSPGNVLVGERPLLIDLVGPALGRERGTPGFVAPEALHGPGGPAADVYALGCLARAIASPEIATEAHAWTAPLLVEDPAARPPAAAVARGLLRCAAPVRWVPAVDAVASLRAAGAAAATVRDPRAWRWRLRRHAVVAAGVVALTGVGGWLWVSLAPGVDHARVALVAERAGTPSEGASAAESSAGGPSSDSAARSTTDAGVRPTAVVAARDGGDPAGAAVELTGARFDALSTGDGEALAALAVPGSGAWAALEHDARLLAQGATVEGLAPPRVDASVLEQDGTTAEVAVTTTIGAHRLVSADGAATEVGPTVEQAILDLVWDGVEWRVSGVSDAP